MTRIAPYLHIVFTALILVTVGLIGYRLFTGQGIFVRTDQAAVITEMRNLNRLETSIFTIEKIIEAGTQGNAFGELLFGDRLLLIAHGNVIAGVDLSQLAEDDITVAGNKVTVSLPDTEIFVSDLDETQTRVYDRRQGLLTKGEKDLEGEARQIAESEIRQAACEAGILQKAAENARTQLTAFLQALDFEEVTVDVEAGSCG
ncbi:MAG TPA: DUF4230 domain-containing protein [Patescibacteria group bacterium]